MNLSFVYYIIGLLSAYSSLVFDSAFFLGLAETSEPLVKKPSGGSIDRGEFGQYYFKMLC